MARSSKVTDRYSSSVLRRLKFIDFRLSWVGDIGRADLHDQFGISLQQATNDLGTYQEIASENLRYSPQKRRYIADAAFEAVFPTTTVRGFLRRLFRSASSASRPYEGWIGRGLDVKLATPPTRDPSKKVMRPILQAIREKKVVEIDYVSMTSGRSTGRRIAPHALGYDGFRWHARAYCYKRNRYLDFVLTRISNVKKLTDSTEALDDDYEWTSDFSFDVVPARSLTPEKRFAIALDFQMQFAGSRMQKFVTEQEQAEDARLTVYTNHAMLYYTLRLYGFDPRKIASEQTSLQSMFGLELVDSTHISTGLSRDV